MIRSLTGAAIRRPVLVIVLWVVVVGAGYGFGVGVFQRLTAEVGAVPGSESARAGDLRAAAEPQPEKITVLVTGHPDGDPVLAAAVEDVRRIPGISEVDGPLRADDGAALLFDVTIAAGDGEEAAAEAAAKRLREVDPAGVTVAGGPLSDREFGAQAQSDVQRAETLTLPVVLVLLVLVFGGLIAGSMPLLVALSGVGATFGLLFAFSFVTDVSVYAIQVATMLSIGLAVDYGLLLIQRFREERASIEDIPVAVERAMATAGRTVFFTGLTVAVSMCGLTVFPDPFLRSMGIAGAAVVVIDMLAALTLIPALLVLVGRRVKPGSASTRNGVFGRVATAVQRRPLVTGLVAAAIMLLLAAPAVGLRLTNGDARSLPRDTQTRQQYEALQEHYPQLVGPDPIIVVARVPAGDTGLAELRDRIAALPGVSTVESHPLSLELSQLSVRPTQDGVSVAAIRALPAPFEVLVTGQAARLVDYRAMLASYGPWAALVVALATLVLLFGFTGSVLLPIKAVLTSTLSIGAALGAVVWVFQDGHLAKLFGTERFGGVDLTVPVLVAAIAFGLSVDYEAFLLSRIRESWLSGAAPQRAVAEGLQRTGRIVTSAALLLVIVFVGFLVAGFAPIKELGLGLVLAVALDATIVRMLLVPASMTLLGRYNWWAPRSLRVLHQRFIR